MPHSISTSGQLKEIFQIPVDYSDFTPLKNEKVGFSVQRKYPPDIRFKPPQTKNGDPDTVAIIYVILLSGEEKEHDGKIPIFLNVRTFSKYLSSHFDYNFSDPDCPTEESVLESKSSKKPIDLESSDGFSYDPNTDNLENSKGRIVTGTDILGSIFQEHIDTVHPFRGFVIHGKIGLRNSSLYIVEFLVRLLIFLIKIISGRVFEPKDPASGWFKEYSREDMKLLKTDYLDIFGYKASKNLIVIFCVIALIVFFIDINFPLRARLAYGFKTYNIISIGFVIISLYILETVFPLICLFLINLLIKIKINLTFAKFKTKLW